MNYHFRMFYRSRSRNNSTARNLFVGCLILFGSLVVTACYSGEGSELEALRSRSLATDTTESALSHLESLGFSYDETKHDIRVSEQARDNQTVWVVSISSKGYYPVKKVEPVTLVIDGEEVKTIKITPRHPHDPNSTRKVVITKVVVSKVDGRIIDTTWTP